ncbi:hypothetical protein AAMO2058_000774900 [Amorphochlora amoebiformis]
MTFLLIIGSLTVEGRIMRRRQPFLNPAEISEPKKRDPYDYGHMSPRARRLYDQLRSHTESRDRIESTRSEDPKAAAREESSLVLRKALDALKGKRLLDPKAIKSKLKAITHSKKKGENRWEKKIAQERLKSLRNLDLVKQELHRRGQNKKAEALESALAASRKDPNKAIPHVAGVRKTIRRVDRMASRRLRSIQKAKSSQDNTKSFEGSERGRFGKETGLGKKRAKTPRKPLGKRLTGFKARRAHKGGSTGRWKKRMERVSRLRKNRR